MKVRRLELRHFNNHTATTAHLPERGVVLVTGDNGAGKSSLLEAVAWGAWGRTVRGTPPVLAEGGKECAALLEGGDGGVRIYRARRAKYRANLTWSPVEVKVATEYETATKAQEALDLVIGSFEHWRRTCVFTSVDAWSFAEATDAERKRLLETLLGLQRLDLALERCKVDLRGESAALALAERDVAHGTERVASAGSTLQALLGVSPDAAPIPDASAVAKRAATLQALLGEIDGDRQAVLAEQREARERLVLVRERAKQLRETADAMRGGVCALCAQPVRVMDPEELETAIAGAVRDLESAAEEVGRRCAAALAQLEDDARTAQQTLAGVSATLRIARDHEQRVRASANAIASARAALVAAEKALEGATATRARLAERVALLGHTERVLGLRGVRAQVLDGALRATEQMANVWLARMSGGRLSLSLGVEADKVSLTVRGAGGGHGYVAASAGERRRMALALMLALAELSAASSGMERGTLWFDEVFDVLDDEGVGDVCSALGMLAQDRAVVVITHSAAVIDHLPNATRLHLTGGAIAGATR